MTNFFKLFIIFCWLAAFIYVGAKAFGTKCVAKISRGGYWRFLLLIIAVLIFIFLPALRSHPVKIVPSSGLAPGLIAAALSFIGVVVIIWARTVLGANWSSFVVIKEGHELVTSGPYQYVRHPIYSGLLLLILGLFVWAGNLLGYIIFFIIFVGFWLKGRQEEKLLGQYFGEKYQAYKKQTKAFVPFLF